MLVKTADRVRSRIEGRKLLKATPETTVRRAAMLMAVKRVGAIAVMRDGQLLGIFTERDALFRVIAKGLDPEQTPLADVMTPAPHTIRPDQTLECAREIMRVQGFRHLPVVEDEETIGMVSSRS